MDPWQAGQIRPVPLDDLGSHFRRYRFRVPQAVQVMAQSLRRWGQCAPIVVCWRHDKPEILDGFTRWEAARQVRGLTTLSARLIEADDRRAKAAIYGLNQAGRRPHELEEARIVQALVREDGLSQVEVAELLGRHKSWVCRRLALLEKLTEDVRQELEVGLLSPSVARELARLPAGNQTEALAVARRDALSAAELAGVVQLLLAAATAEQRAYVLTQPRQAVQGSQAAPRQGWDARLSSVGNRVSRQLASLLDQLAAMENFLECRGRASLLARDRLVLQPVFERLAEDATRVAAQSGALAREMAQP
jgi:ParB/RepB/Spo0J family partition protein